MKNFVQPGEILTLTAPEEDLVSGQPLMVEDLFVVATASAIGGEPFEAFVGPGVVSLPKPDDESWGEGEKIYFDESEGNVTTDDDGASNPLIGVAAKAAATEDTTGDVRLDGVAR